MKENLYFLKEEDAATKAKELNASYMKTLVCVGAKKKGTMNVGGRLIDMFVVFK